MSEVFLAELLPSPNFHYRPCVVHCQQFVLNNIVSETTRHRALIFRIMHFLIDHYQFCSNDDPGPKMALQWWWGGGGVGLENKIYLKYLFLPNC